MITKIITTEKYPYTEPEVELAKDGKLKPISKRAERRKKEREAKKKNNATRDKLPPA